MNIKLTLLLMFVAVSGMPLCAQTQAELTAASRNRLKIAELELKNVVDRLVKDYKADKEFISALHDSQEMWKRFRQAELKMRFPDRDPSYYGSSHQMCVNEYLTELTNDRIKKLHLWMDGVEDGDICSGSVKWKQPDSTDDK